MNEEHERRLCEMEEDVRKQRATESPKKERSVTLIANLDNGDFVAEVTLSSENNKFSTEALYDAAGYALGQTLQSTAFREN